jgi:hypothetical protein
MRTLRWASSCPHREVDTEGVSSHNLDMKVKLPAVQRLVDRLLGDRLNKIVRDDHARETQSAIDRPRRQSVSGLSACRGPALYDWRMFTT